MAAAAYYVSHQGHTDLLVHWTFDIDWLCGAGTLYLEFWKREQMQIQFRWNVTNFEKEEVR